MKSYLEEVVCFVTFFFLNCEPKENFICLIGRKEEVVQVKDFRAISLVNETRNYWGKGQCLEYVAFEILYRSSTNCGLYSHCK